MFSMCILMSVCVFSNMVNKIVDGEGDLHDITQHSLMTQTRLSLHVTSTHYIRNSIQQQPNCREPSSPKQTNNCTYAKGKDERLPRQKHLNTTEIPTGHDLSNLASCSMRTIRNNVHAMNKKIRINSIFKDNESYF